MSQFRKLLAGFGVAASLLVLPATASLAQTSASAYTTGYRFDSLRRIAGVISPDPDGSGSIGFPAVRYTYDADDNVFKTETGFLAAWQAETVLPANWTNFTIKSVKTNTLDAMGNKTQELTTGGSGEKLALTQTAYDADDRSVCSVVRMNLATTATNACALGTAGSYGNDRITTTHYNSDGHVDYTKRAVGSTNEQFYARYGYSANGNKIAETDANGNLTNYVYDGLDRLAYTYYPSLTTGAGASNSADYESYGYDNNGNRTTYRRRNGQTYTYQYDAVNQQVLKTRSDNTGLNVASSYDLMGHLIRAQFANSSGTVSYSYDAIGRVLTTTDMYGQALSYQYDQASLRTLMTFQDGKQQIYQYNAGNQLSWTGISGSTVGYGVGYDAFDRPATITRANSANSAIGYDNADRVTSFGHSFATTSRNVTWGFSFNPAGGIVSMSTTNTDFDYREQQSATENHTFNGLNQDAAIAALAMICSSTNAGYDCSGNLTNDSNRHFTYDIDNHLTALSGPASASYVYDPIGRLVQTTVNGTVTRFLYDGVNLVAEYDGLGAIQRRYMHTLGTDQPWVQFTGSAVGASNAKYLYGDYHGSIIALADSTGAVANADIYKYGTYGEPLDINNNLSFSGSRFRYTGQTVLPEASLYYYKARVYDPVFGRFLQTDPIGSKDDLDLYAYTANDPVNKADSSGLQEADPYEDDVRTEGEFRYSVGSTGGRASNSNSYRGAILVRPGTLVSQAEIDDASANDEAQATYDQSCSTNPLVGAKQTQLRVQQRSYQTYTKTNPSTGKVYTGRTSGTGTPAQNIARRDSNHHMNSRGYGAAVLRNSSSNSDAIRGDEQAGIDENGGARSQGGTSGNAINGVSNSNTNADKYRDARDKTFGD